MGMCNSHKDKDLRAAPFSHYCCSWIGAKPSLTGEAMLHRTLWSFFLPWTSLQGMQHTKLWSQYFR